MGTAACSLYPALRRSANAVPTEGDDPATVPNAAAQTAILMATPNAPRIYLAPFNESAAAKWDNTTTPPAMSKPTEN